ncbi:MAG: GTPase [Candidatus Eisenbacteria bacterium]|uniref:GTPase n=1 Tax=Eiseniibacteriota bacterium TaxID=2212470 RepID=A0A956RRY3_UNCEI|nr:GTPase [Candidatus Eisenbacteria bacterium]
MADRKRVVILGAGGRDFHNFNRAFRDDPSSEVVAFTATQIPGIENRPYPKELSGPLYPEGIPIVPESQIEQLIRERHVQEVVFSYSDVSHVQLMRIGCWINALGPDFRLLGTASTSVESHKPVIAVVASRTGCGKSQTSRRVAEILRDRGLKVVAIRHPMPYGDLRKQGVQRFGELADLDRHECTIEEREEYEPHIVAGNIIYAGVDYEAILREAEKEADVILWDGGNNDFSFYQADLTITVVDPHRPGHELDYYPGTVNLHLADAVVINKMETADPTGIATVRENVQRANPSATIVEAASPVSVPDPAMIRGKRVLVIEDGPTLTHGGMKYGAGMVAARKHGAAEIVDPRPWLVGELQATFQKYPGIGTLLPAMGYGPQQIADLEATIRKSDCDAVLIATPIDLGRLIKIDQPAVRVGYELCEIGRPNLTDVIEAFYSGRTGWS